MHAMNEAPDRDAGPTLPATTEEQPKWMRNSLIIVGVLVLILTVVLSRG